MLDKKDLKELNQLFNNVKDKDESEFNSFFTLPDGMYKATIDDMEITESKSGKPMFVILFEITQGEFKGETHKQFIMLSGNDDTQRDRNINRFATTVKKLGADTTSLETAINSFNKGLGKKVILTIETTVSRGNGKSYTNTSFELEV